MERVAEASQWPRASEAEECREQREAAVHRLKHVIEKQRHSYVERVRDEVDGVICNKPGLANEDLGGYCCKKVKQINDTGNPNLRVRRSGTVPQSDSMRTARNREVYARILF